MENGTDPEVVLIDQLPSNSWVEGLALRPNGHGLLSRLDQPELWSIDISDPEAKPQLLHTFPGANGVINLCALKGCVDEYAVITSILDLDTVSFHTFMIWRVSLSADDSRPPKVSKIADVADCGMCISLNPVSERTLLIGDARKGSIIRLDIVTGKSSVLIADESMELYGKDDFFGLNRVHLSDHHLWFTNNSGGMLCRIPIEWDESDPDVGVRTTGPVELVVEDIPHCDGLALSTDATTAYMANYLGGMLWRVDIDPATGTGKTHTVMEHLVSPTSMELVYGNGKPKLYVVCCGEIEIGWVHNDDRRSWSDLANINEAVEVSVTVTTDEAA